MSDNESDTKYKFRYQINPLHIRLNDDDLSLCSALENYFEYHKAETSDELEDDLYNAIGECAQSLWFEDYKEVEKWVNAYGLAKAMRAMRESGFSFDDLLSGFEKEGDEYSFAHDETIYVRLLATIITERDLVSVVEIEENEEVEGLEAGMTELAIPESD